MSPLALVRAAELSDDTAQTAGMARAEAVSGRTVGARCLWMGRAVVAPRTTSAAHHHGESETGIYVVAGRPEFWYRDGDQIVRLRPAPGDYVWVPPHVPHVEANPHEVPAVVVIARSTQEAVVVNLDDL
ncbi:MAG: cupin domain-containing protein [Egibacteraceae bacterium]